MIGGVGTADPPVWQGPVARRAVAVVVAVMLTLLVASCGGGPATSQGGSGPGSAGAGSSPTSVTTTTTTTTTTTSRPSSLDDLKAFFTAASGVDTGLRAAAIAVNGGIGTDRIEFDQAVVDAVHAADPGAVAAALVAGLPPPLLQSALVVYNDLVSRRGAFNGVTVGTFTPSDYDYTYNRMCLRNGSAPAARFADDLAASERLAATLPPVGPAAPDSLAAEELAVRLMWIELGNNGCAGCGGFVVKDLVPLTRYAVPVTPPGSPTPADGNIDGIPFSATYVAGTGWDVVLQAC